MGSEEPSWETLWSELRLEELSNRCFGAESPPAWVVVALGALGKRSAVEIALAAESVPEAWLPLARRVAARALVRLGASRHASEQLQALEAAGHAAMASKLERELAAEAGRASTGPGLVAECALRDGFVQVACEALERGLTDAHGDTAPLVWLDAMPLLVGIELANERWQNVTAVCERFSQRFPRSSSAPGWRLVGATAALYAGDRAPLELLAADEQLPASVRQAASWLTQRLELATTSRYYLGTKAPIFTGSGVHVELEGREVLRRLLSEPTLDVRPTSLAGIRAELARRGHPLVRCTLDEARLIRLLELDSAVIVAEERAVGTGFAKLVGYERTTGLLLVERFDQPGAALHTWAEQSQRCALHAFGAIALVPSAAPLAAELLDERLDALDACESDVREAHAGRGRSAYLAEQALAKCEDVPRAWQLRGEALVEQLKAGELESTREDGPVESWYADARTRFETAEWAHQIYATCLELWGASHEAVIAWADARSLDENDYRNALGLSRNRLRQGYAESAFLLANEALSRAPEKLEAWVALAAAALETYRPRHASLASSAALEVAPNDLSALRVLGVTLERNGELAEAAAVHERAAQQPSDRGAAALRASLSLMRLGELERARQRALEVMQKDPAQGDGYRLAAMAFRALGDSSEALSVLEFGLSRVGPEPALLEAYAKAVAGGLDAESRAERVERALELFGEHPDVLGTFAEKLLAQGQLDLAERLLDAASAAAGESLAAPWRRACLYAKAKRFADCVAVLEPLLGRSNNAYFVCLLDCAERRTGKAPSLERLRLASLDAQPALVWGVTHGVAVTLGDQALQQSLEQRLFGMAADALVDAARFLAEHALLDDADGLVKLALRHPRAEQATGAPQRVELSVLHGRGEYAAAAQLAVAAHQQHPELPVLDAELESAFRARDASALARLAQKRLSYIERGASLEWGDGVKERALLAAAESWAGNAQAFEELLARCPQHPALLEIASEVLGHGEVRS